MGVMGSNETAAGWISNHPRKSFVPVRIGFKNSKTGTGNWRHTTGIWVGAEDLVVGSKRDF
jgi:hypothetical protein